jgi:hypothetical protein
MTQTREITVPNTEMNIFEKYIEAVKKHVDGLSKTRAIELCSRPSARLILPTTIRKFYESMNCEGWKQSVGANWVWRYKEPGETKSEEVLLERAVAILDTDMWACQLSTSSGVEGPYLHRRRAIDLVRHLGPCQYAFVELKVDSDNPLFAAFEILGYALAYLHAKANDWSGSGDHDVFDAAHIELTILGPKKWFGYVKRGTEMRLDKNLDWLIKEIAESLNGFVKAEFPVAPLFTMKFREFSGDNRDLQARNINEGAKKWRTA